MATKSAYSVTSNVTKLLKHLNTLKGLQNGIVSPIMVHAIPTHRCQLNCTHCCFKNRKDKNADMPLEQFVEAMRWFYELGTRAVEFSVAGNEIIPVVNNGQLELKTIKDLVETKPNVCSCSIDRNGNFVEGKINAFIKHPLNNPLLKIILQGGRAVVVTRGHSIYFYENNHIILKSASEAKIGDIVVLVSHQPQITCQTHIKFQEKTIDIDEDLCRLIGYFIAEGSYTFQRKHIPHGINFTFGKNIQEKKYIYDVIAIIKKLGMRALVYHHDHKTQILVANKWLCELFLSLKTGQHANQKRVPNIILNVNKECKLAFLVGLFAGDGHFRNKITKKKFYRNQLVLKTASSTLQKTLCYLLDTLGIVATFGSGRNNERFIGKRKLKESDYYTISINNKTNIEKVNSVIEFMGCKPKYINSKYSNYQPNIKKIKINNSCYGLRIRDIRQHNCNEKNVYDLSVGDTNNFENSFGILCHNTGGGDPPLWPPINIALQYLKQNGWHMGIITNGLGGEYIEHWEYFDWVRVSLNTLDYRDDIDLSYLNETQKSFCYIWNKHSPKKIGKVAEFAEKHKTICRIAPDCIVPTWHIVKQLDGIRQVLGRFKDNKYIFLSDFNIDIERPNHDCRIHMIKPCLYLDGWVYACPSAELAVENDKQIQPKARICRYDKIYEWYMSEEALKSRDLDCSYCKYVKQQWLLEMLLMKTKDNEFC